MAQFIQVDIENPANFLIKLSAVIVPILFPYLRKIIFSISIG
ncbi:hypothetical protein ELI_2566 [Eubacterium callanderi]|uniref:Uncharacterized protein n=1 Tax=Eubacterium callanderi TaxID=53442 RepID=E3GE53_9FIRM|nr:hypothetical protein ELI_2566 [Eubacterium callanderi]